jgi:hypothetical protein
VVGGVTAHVAVSDNNGQASPLLVVGGF